MKIILIIVGILAIIYIIAGITDGIDGRLSYWFRYDKRLSKREQLHELLKLTFSKAEKKKRSELRETQMMQASVLEMLGGASKDYEEVRPFIRQLNENEVEALLTQFNNPDFESHTYFTWFSIKKYPNSVYIFNAEDYFQTDRTIYEQRGTSIKYLKKNCNYKELLIFHYDTIGEYHLGGSEGYVMYDIGSNKKIAYSWESIG